MAFRLDLNRYQPLYTPLAILSSCLLIAVVIYTSGGITITVGGQKGSESPAVAGETGTQTGELDDFAKCLTEKGAKLYTADWCPHCVRQKELFGSSLQYLDHIVCAKEQTDPWSESCTKAQITGVPTWIFKNGSREHFLELEELSERTGCPFK